MEARKILVNGTVQAVGFRPFVYRIAHQCNLDGWVKNLGDAGVEIFVQGEKSDIKRFLGKLKKENPPLASIDQVSDEGASPKESVNSFEIKESSGGSSGSGTIPPDIATCDKCLKDVFGDGRFEGYWATSCVNCGPRFTVIRKLPYDRDKTSMDEFPMCEECRAEYTDPMDRRHHAQTIACPRCGPELRYYSREGTVVGNENQSPVEKASEDLKSDRIVAIHGLGGCHLACNASEGGSIEVLREKLDRPQQPFALMGTEEMVDSVAEVSKSEREVLTSPRRPIMILRKKEESPLSSLVSPGLDTVGIMLPYTALHYLIFERIDFPLVMTSANIPGRPMLKDPGEIRERLEGVADGFLLHDRRIVSRCDDSVVRFSGGSPKFIRRSRGWVPEGISMDLGDRKMLALGAEQDNVFALYTGGKAYLSQYLGDIDDPESLGFLEKALDRMLELTDTDLPRVVAHDLHPSFLTTKKAKEIGEDNIPIQHHIAHLGSLLAENGLSEGVGITVDGVGYGLDGDVWGGEVITARDGRYERKGGLSKVYMPGGDLATKVPDRMVLGILYPLSRKGEIVDPEKFLASRNLQLSLKEKEKRAVLSQLESGLNAPRASSAGRFLDAVSSLLSVCTSRSYEGEPAMKLESAAREGDYHSFELPYTGEKGENLDQSLIFLHLIEMIGDFSVEDIAATAQWSMAEGLAHLAVKEAREGGFQSIGLSGGVAYNGFISRYIRDRVRDSGFDYVENQKVPPGDGGIAFGQLRVARDKIENRSE